MEVNRAVAALKRLEEAAIRCSFAMLDLTLALTPLEDQPARSWEVEREQFLRRLGEPLS